MHLQSPKQNAEWEVWGVLLAFYLLFHCLFVVLLFVLSLRVFDGFGNLCGGVPLPTFYSMGPKIVTKSLGKAFWVEVGMSPSTCFQLCFKLCKGTLSLWIHLFFSLSINYFHHIHFFSLLLHSHSPQRIKSPLHFLFLSFFFCLLSPSHLCITIQSYILHNKLYLSY